MTLFARRRFETQCTVELEHSQESLHAHVVFAGMENIGPGDKVRVHGAPIRLKFGERMTFHRLATIERAHWFERLWVRFAARFDLAELYEVSFSPRRAL
jgi:hypothetical protein